jgi:hypothetical protein
LDGAFQYIPMAIESFNFKGYALILSCSHFVAKGVISSPDALHISYVLTLNISFCF